MNNVTLAGNLTGDPQLRFSAEGRALATFSVAVSRRLNTNGDWRDHLDGYFRCVKWGPGAERITDSFSKGDRVVVTGRLAQRSWEDDEGRRHEAVEIVVDELAASARYGSFAPKVQDNEQSFSDATERNVGLR